MARGYAGFAASLNTSSLSTLRTLRLQHYIEHDVQDPLCGLCEEFRIISGRNVIEEISLKVLTDSCFKTGSEWGALDAVLSRGFPQLHCVSLYIEIGVCSLSGSGAVLQERVNNILGKYFPWLSSNIQVAFNLSASLHLS